MNLNSIYTICTITDRPTPYVINLSLNYIWINKYCFEMLAEELCPALQWACQLKMCQMVAILVILDLYPIKEQSVWWIFFVLDASWYDDVQINVPAVKRRVEQLTARRTVKKQWQVSRKVVLIDMLIYVCFWACIRVYFQIILQALNLGPTIYVPYSHSDTLSAYSY